MKINVITVLKSGPGWIPEYVIKLKKVVDNFLTIDHDFYCISNVEILEIKTLPMLPSDSYQNQNIGEIKHGSFLSTN